jgi:predicted RNase H-like HicB family nuclease
VQEAKGKLRKIVARNAEEALLGYLEALQINGEELPHEDHSHAGTAPGFG